METYTDDVAVPIVVVVLVVFHAVRQIFLESPLWVWVHRYHHFDDDDNLVSDHHRDADDLKLPVVKCK